MKSTEINQALNRIGEVPGKNDKIALLKEYLEDYDFRWCIEQMLDPRIRFGVANTTLKKITSNAVIVQSAAGWEHCSVDIPILLEELATRNLTGSAAEEKLKEALSSLDADGSQLLWRILLKKPDAGFTASSVNKARPNTVWTFDCMLAHPFEEKRVKEWPVMVQPKIDGVRCLIFVRPTRFATPDVGFFSRSGKEFTTFGAIEDDIGTLFISAPMTLRAPMIIDCEIDSGDFNETVSQARRNSEQAQDAVARCFDLITEDEWIEGKSMLGYIERRSRLIHFAGTPESPKTNRVHVLHQWQAFSHDEILAINAAVQKDGGEGVIVKPHDHLYERKRSHSWGKIKGFETHDLIITGFFEGEGKYAGNLGGVLVDFNGVIVRVGGGFTDADREMIWNNQGDYLGRMIEVGAHEVTPDGSLRHPRFIRWRDDKHDAEAA